MALAVDRLPTDPERLRAIIVEQAAALANKEAELHARSPGGRAESPACRDGYAGFNELYRLAGAEEPRIPEVACWATVQPKFFDLHSPNPSPIAGSGRAPE